jgi:hypothetical protein
MNQAMLTVQDMHQKDNQHCFKTKIINYNVLVTVLDIEVDLSCVIF